MEQKLIVTFGLATGYQTVLCTCAEDKRKLTNFVTSADNPLGRQLSKINFTIVQKDYVPLRSLGKLPLSYEQVRLIPPLSLSMSPRRDGRDDADVRVGRCLYQLTRLGFDGYAIDYCEAEDPILHYLEESCYLGTSVSLSALSIFIAFPPPLHRQLTRSSMSFFRKPISLRDLNSQDGPAWVHVKQTMLRNYVCGNVKYSTSRSKYGAQTVSSGTNDVSPAKSFKGSSSFLHLFPFFSTMAFLFSRG